MSSPGQQVADRKLVAAADEGIAGRPAPERIRGKRLLYQGHDQRVGEGIGPCPPGRHQLRAEKRARALEPGQAHVPGRGSAGPQEHIFEELLD